MFPYAQFYIRRGTGYMSNFKKEKENLVGSSFSIDLPEYEGVTFVFLGGDDERASVKKLKGKNHDYHTCFAKWANNTVLSGTMEKDYIPLYEQPFDVPWSFLEKAKLN